MRPPRARRRSRSLRSRVRSAIATVAVIAVLMFGIPLAVVIDRLIRSDALAALQRDATRAVATVPDNVLQAGADVRVPGGSGSTRIGVYDARGSRVAGTGAASSALARAAADGREHDGHDSGDLAVVVPVLSDTTVAGSVRAAVPLRVLQSRVLHAWALLAALAAGVLLVSILLARRAAARVSAPFEHLTSAARRLGAGEFQVELPRWGIEEADAAGTALRDSGLEIDALVQHEKAFVRDASHQLRTPLSALLVHLEQDRPDVARAVESAHHLETTIDDLLSLRSITGKGACVPGAVATAAVERWNRPDRRVSLRLDDVADAALPEPALRQALDILLDNAMRHGAGDVTVTVEPYGDAVVVEVADQGAGFVLGVEEGTGLRLARSIVERSGGSLLVRRRTPQPRVALLLPATRVDAPAPAPA